MTYSTPLYGIPVPDGTSLAKNLPAELKAMGEGFEAALNAHVAIPVSNAAVVTATSSAARDSYWGTPTTETARLTLQARGATTIRTDKNITERFFATYDATTNPQGMTPAGWYPIGAPSSLIPTTRSAAERDALFGTPSTSATQIELQNRGARTFRTDLGVTEQYFATYNSSTNPGGRSVPGWYSDSRSMGLVPVIPSSVSKGAGTVSVSSTGVVTLTNVTNFSLNGIFSNEFRNYRLIIEGQTTSAITTGDIRLRSGTTDAAGASDYAWLGPRALNWNGISINGTTGGSTWAMWDTYSGGQVSLAIADIIRPYETVLTKFSSVGYHYSNSIGTSNYLGHHKIAASYDGLTFVNASQVPFTGTIQILGIR